MPTTRDSKDYTIFDAIGLKSANFTAATTDIITSNAHGLVNGNMVVLSTTDTLPAGLAVSTVYYVIEKTTNTFKLAKTPEGPAVDITDTGTGTHTFTMHDIGVNVFIEDYRNCVFALASDGGGDADLTVKFQGSILEDCPDFSAAQSATNMWDYIQTMDLQNSAEIDGDNGIVFAAADDNRLLEANINGLRWVNAIISGYTEGEITLRVRLFNNQ